MDNDNKRNPSVEAVWRSYLTTGGVPEGVKIPWFESPTMKAIARHLPAAPRCRMCHYPFGGLGGKLVRSFLQLEPSKLNPQLCNICERFAETNPGGVELEVSVLFADIRGSTSLAANMNTYDFSRLIDRFYQVTTNVIYNHGGMVEKLVGDEVTAFFVPAFSDNHNIALAAILAGQEILSAVGHIGNEKPWVSVGVGIHTGDAFVGAVGEPGRNIDIAVLGDSPNIASRLTGQAKAGEIIMSDITLRKAGLQQKNLEPRSLNLKGRDEPIDVWVFKAGS